MAEAPPALAGLALGLWLGPGAHLVHYPIRRGTALNIVAIVSDRSMAEGWDNAGDPQALIARYRGWCADARSLVAAPQAWRTWPLADRPVWFGGGQGASTLIGDAAHAMPPFLAQGGAMAIEDAAVLAKACAARRDDLPGAFRAYEAERRARVEAVQRVARANGRIYHLEGPLAFARDMAMRVAGGRRMIEAYDWIYRFRV
jgi:salicylate hydroxylase